MKTKTIFVVLTMIFSLCFCGIGSEAYNTKHKNITPRNGANTSYYNNKSSTLWIGDSRIMQMYNSFSKDSYVAVWGGHYGWGKQSMRIDSKKRTKDIKRIINKIISQNGHAKVVLCPTINDYDGNQNYKWAFKYFKKIYKKIDAMGPCATIVTPGIIKARNGKSLRPFNNAVHKLDSKYVNIKMKTKWYSDSLHFTKKGLKHIRKQVKKRYNS